MKADAVEIRVLGCLIEKQRTTPDAYPLSLVALRTACNQTTNRDPVVQYDEALIQDALERLGRRRWARLASAGGRTVKHRQLLDETLGLSGGELAALCVCLLRGPQTAGELRTRTERLHPFGSSEELEGVIDRLVERRLLVRVRRPGQKESRVAQTLGDEVDEAATRLPDSAADANGRPPPAPDAADHAAGAALADRVTRLEQDLEALRASVSSLQEALGA